MKKLSLAAVALTALIAAPAMAADLAVKAPAYKAPPPVYLFSWTGCYVGANAGGLWVNKDFTDRTGDPFFGQSFGSQDASSWLGGVQIGCNYQFAGGWVVGIQGDYDWTDANNSRTNILFPVLRDHFKVKSLASVTGRVGYAWDRFLGYVKGGGAWEQDNYDIATIATGTTFATASETRGGWTVGIGGEYAFTNWLTGFVEYDYYNFGTRSNNFTCAAVGCFVGGLSAAPIDVKETKSVFKVGLNLLWGGGPVVAKY